MIKFLKFKFNDCFYALIGQKSDKFVCLNENYKIWLFDSNDTTAVELISNNKFFNKIEDENKFKFILERIDENSLSSDIDHLISVYDKYSSLKSGTCVRYFDNYYLLIAISFSNFLVLDTYRKIYSIEFDINELEVVSIKNYIKCLSCETSKNSLKNFFPTLF